MSEIVSDVAADTAICEFFCDYSQTRIVMLGMQQRSVDIDGPDLVDQYRQPVRQNIKDVQGR